MFYWGVLATLLIGISLGLFGGGGSTLTVPVLVYWIGMPATQATADSLFIVGCSSLLSALPHWRKGNVELGRSLLFLLGSVSGAVLARGVLVPILPERIGTIARDNAMMLAFAAVMLLAALSMLRTKDINNRRSPPEHLLVVGLVVGVVTGTVGAGGGFLIVPALVLYAGIPLRIAMGTSLVVIAANTLLSFGGALVSGYHPDWAQLLLLTSLPLFGSLIGSALSARLKADRLRKSFAWFILALAVLISIVEIVRLML